MRAISAAFLILFSVASKSAIAQGVADLETPISPLAMENTFTVCEVPDNWGTSAAYLQYTARCAFKSAETGSTDAKRIALIEDIFIKSWSYAFMNKIFFWASIIFAVLVLVWPSLVALLRSDPVQDAATEALAFSGTADAETLKLVQKKRSILIRLVGVASMQTTVTALAALSFAFYTHYKDKQTTSESLMRSVLYSKELDQTQIDSIVDQIARMDSGFGFAKALPSIGEKDPNAGG